MTAKAQKIISAAYIGFVAFFGFEAIIYILNLYQLRIFIQTAFIVWVFLAFQIIFLYDLHFKKRGSLDRAKEKHANISAIFKRLLKISHSALKDRLSHLLTADFVKQFFNYLLLPGFIFWSSIVVFFVNFNFYKVQQAVVLLSSLALILNFWYLKEAFVRKKEIVDSDVFITLSVVKIYACTVAFGASIAIIRYYCLSPWYMALGVMAVAFFMVYQALFQHKMINLKNLAVALLIGCLMGVTGYFMVMYWGYNYFSGAVFMSVIYNLMWGTFHYHLDRALTWKVFWEIFAIGIIIAAMVFSTTNFRAKILDSCQYFN